MCHVFVCCLFLFWFQFLTCIQSLAHRIRIQQIMQPMQNARQQHRLYPQRCREAQIVAKLRYQHLRAAHGKRLGCAACQRTGARLDGLDLEHKLVRVRNTHVVLVLDVRGIRIIGAAGEWTQRRQMFVYLDDHVPRVRIGSIPRIDDAMQEILRSHAELDSLRRHIGTWLQRLKLVHGGPIDVALLCGRNHEIRVLQIGPIVGQKRLLCANHLVKNEIVELGEAQ